MENLKALGILQEALENEKESMKGYEYLSNIDYIQEAIEELKVLHEYNTCKTCKFKPLVCDMEIAWQKVVFNNLECSDGTKLLEPFGCNKYEPKAK